MTINSVVFSSGNQSYQVSQIAYVGPVWEIPPEKKKTDATHSFRIVTRSGGSYCYYKSFETARNARGALAAMLRSVKPGVFSHANQLVDPEQIISYSKVFPLKENDQGHTHAFVAIIDTIPERNRRVWFRFRSEEAAQHTRNALFGRIHGINNGNGKAVETEAPGSVEEAAVAQKEPAETPF